MNTTGISTNSSEADSWLLKYTGKNFFDHVNSRNRGVGRTFFIASLLPNMTADRKTREIVFASRGEGENPMRLHLTRCTTCTTYLDAKITCISKGALGKATCGVDAVREMPSPPSPPSYSVLTEGIWGMNSFADFMDILDDVPTGSGVSSNTEYYIANPLKAFAELETQYMRNYTDLGYLDIGTFERRFALLWNTLWKIGWTRASIMGGKPTPPLKGDRLERLLNTTSTIVTPLPPVYAINRAWLTIYFISVGVMLAAAVFSLVMRAMCRAPVLLGYVSTLMRDSRYFDDCGMYTSSVEDGSDKSKRLGKLRVMVANVEGGSGKENAGKIAFAPAEVGKRVEKGRWYD